MDSFSRCGIVVYSNFSSSIGSKLLQVGLVNVEPLAQAILPQRVGCNPMLENLATITNMNLEESHIVHLQAFLQTAVNDCFQVHLHVALILVYHLKLNQQFGQHLVH